MKNRLLNKLHNHRSKYEKIIRTVEDELREYIDEEFSIIYQSSDGFVLIIETNTIQYNVPLNEVLETIQATGEFCIQDYII